MIAFCIKTFQRNDELERLIESIKNFYPKAKIYIADDSENPLGLEKTYKMDFDSGLSAGRNLLIRKTKEPYLLFLDDDFVFTKDTKIEKLVEILENNKDIGLVGGSLRQGGSIRHYEGYVKFKGDNLIYTKKLKDRVNFKEAGLVFNFFLARRELFDYVRWDEELKLAEHSDFFLRLSYTPWKVGYCDDVIVDHIPNRNGDYGKFRDRGSFFTKIFMRKRGIERIINYEEKTFKI